jgi:hypothetical protein
MEESQKAELALIFSGSFNFFYFPFSERTGRFSDLWYLSFVGRYSRVWKDVKASSPFSREKEDLLFNKLPATPAKPGLLATNSP